MRGVIVTFRYWAEADSIAAEYGARVEGRIPRFRTAKLVSTTGESDEALAARLSADRARIDGACPNRVLRPMGYLAPANDALADESWHWKRVGLWRAHKLLQDDTLRRFGAARIGDPNLRVAVLDSGYRHHEDVPDPIDGANIGRAYDYESFSEIDDTYCTTPPLLTGRDPDPVNDPGYTAASTAVCLRNSHGHAVASLIFARANNGLGVIGAAPGCGYLNARVNVDGVTSYEYLQAGSDWALSKGARILSVSQGYFAPASDPLSHYAWTAQVWGSGGAVVAAAGNDNQNLDTFGTYLPGEASLTLTVGSIAKDNRRVDATERSGEDITYHYGSNYGAAVDIVAPGVHLRAASFDWPYEVEAYPPGILPSTFYGWFTGTSGATPQASGGLALVWSANPALTNAQAVAILRETADPINDPDFPNAGCVSYDVGTARSLSTVPANAGRIYTACHFYGPGLWGSWDLYHVENGVETAKVPANAGVKARISAFSSDAITNVTLRAGTTVLYSGAPGLVSLDADALAANVGQPLTLTTSTAALTLPETLDALVVPPNPLRLTASAAPAVAGVVVLSGWRVLNSTVTVTCPTATVGAMTDPVGDGSAWRVPLSGLAPGANDVTVSDSTGGSLTLTVQGAGLTVDVPAELAAVSFPISASGTAIPGDPVYVYNDDSGELLGSVTADASTGAWSMQIGHA